MELDPELVNDGTLMHRDDHQREGDNESHQRIWLKLENNKTQPEI